MQGWEAGNLDTLRQILRDCINLYDCNIKYTMTGKTPGDSHPLWNSSLADLLSLISACLRKLVTGHAS